MAGAEKIVWRGGTQLAPVPVVLVGCGDKKRWKYNLITVAWCGTVASDPPQLSVSIRKERHSHAIISRCGEFVINLTTEALAYATDWCGVKSGRDFDKFKEMKLTAERGQIVKAPLIGESPLNIECRVTEVKELGSHDMFLAEVVAIDAEESLIDKGTGAFQLNHAQPLAYSHGRYYGLGERLGGFGFSVKKK